MSIHKRGISCKLYKSSKFNAWKNLKAELVIEQKTAGGGIIKCGDRVTILNKSLVRKGRELTFNSGYFNVRTSCGRLLKVNYSHLKLLVYEIC